MTRVCLTEAAQWNLDPPMRRQAVCENQSCVTNSPSEETRCLDNYLIGRSSGYKEAACLKNRNFYNDFLRFNCYSKTHPMKKKLVYLFEYSL